MNTPLENEVAKRFGILPNFFRLASSDPTIAANLWGFAQFAYLDNPLPSLFKERLFVYLSRFCDVRYCIARHVGFLAGLGHPAGDSSCLPQSVESILPLLRRPLPHGDGLVPLFATCAEFDSPLNRQAVEIWGRTPEMDGPPWSFLDSRRLYRADGTLLRPEEAPIREVLATGVPIVNFELVLERPDFSRINLLANITELRDSSGLITGAVSIFQDITELKRIQHERETLLHELERSNRELSQFSYSVSHDLQAPVRAVRALTQLLVRPDDKLRDDSSHLLTLIEQATSGMERLIDSLLRYAQAGEGQLNRQRVSVGQIVETVRMTLAPLITETGAQIVCAPLPSVEADPVLLEQLLQNLVANALLYRRPGEAPVVEISGGRSGDVWQFAVKDNGQGIPLEYQGRVFEPLKRLHGSETPGTGLGLALCRTIIARHGGCIWVESEGSGHGAIFRFTLQAAHASP